MPHVAPTQLQGITDLTLIAEVGPGLIDGIFDSRSYAWRLKRVLELLDAARRASREADKLPNPFVDGVGRLRGIHFFRFALLPDDKLLLNVTFDGGWEPYLRLIWGPLGTMLDLIFCHCPSYPLAAVSSYGQYIRWIREHEVPSQFFYADSAGSAADRSYLERLEAQQRLSGGQSGADLRAAQAALAPPRPPQPSQTTAAAAVRSLKGLYSLLPYFGAPVPGPGVAPGGARDHRAVLLRFAQDYLPDLREWIAQGLFDPGQRFDTLRPTFMAERQWLMNPRWTRPEKLDPPGPLLPEQLQAGLLSSPRADAGRHLRGALVLARVTRPADARAWLADAARDELIGSGAQTTLVNGDVLCTVALTYAGLQALEVHETRLAAMPGEFIQGMEARAGILGDVRINHPQQWRRPRAPWRGTAAGTGAPIDLTLAHLVIQLRTPEADDERADDRSPLLSRLEAWIDMHLPESGPFEVLAVEPAWSRPVLGSELAGRDHFGYVDGISQPSLAPSGGQPFWEDAVKAGELLLGRINDRGDGPPPRQGAVPLPPDPAAWMELGSFVVVRKIRQYVEHFDAIVGRAAQALAEADPSLTPDGARELARAKLMGRYADGTPLVAQRGTNANDFDYRNDGDAAQCPFASHVRRANPRAKAPGTHLPRIMRRGMGYGPAPEQPNPRGRDQDERGVLFMAYNASIAEQFEVIQRWLSGGNSSGVSSSQPDPLLGVPRLGEPSVFRFAAGDKVVRVDLGDQPVCQLEWGLYAFVPSMALLSDLAGLAAPDGALAPSPSSTSKDKAAPTALADPAAPSQPPSEAEVERLRQQVKERFEDELCRQSSWLAVRSAHGGVEKIGPSVMVGSREAAMAVLRDNGDHFSVSGYGGRMTHTLGASPFGEDHLGGTGHARAFVGQLKQAIATSVSEATAYDTAYAIVTATLAPLLKGARTSGSAASVDVGVLGAALIAGLCEQWFGVDFADGSTEPGGLDPKETPVRCPGHFLSLARNVFSAYPNETVKTLATLHGAAVKPWAATLADKASTAPVLAAMQAQLAAAVDSKQLAHSERAGVVANALLGLPATLLGSWAKVVIAWVADRRLWRFQHDLGIAPAPYDGPTGARALLRDALIATMAKDPVADGIWRTAAKPAALPQLKAGGEPGTLPIERGDVLWLGLGAAMADLPGGLQDPTNLPMAEDLLFGGNWQPHTPGYTPHACPARSLAIGALLGGLAALLQAGELAQTASPVVLSLKPMPMPMPEKPL